MPDDATGPTPDPTPAAAAPTAAAPTTTAQPPLPARGERAGGERSTPKWGDDPETIPQARRDELLALHETQKKWLAETGPDRDYRQSPFAQATRPKGIFRTWDDEPTGAEIFFLRRQVGGVFADDLHLEGATLLYAHLEGADLHWAHLEGADLSMAHLEGAALRSAHLAGANLRAAHLAGARLGGAHLEGANLSDAHLEGAKLLAAHLEGARLGGAYLAGAKLLAAHLEGADLRSAHLAGADLRGAFFDTATDLTDAVIFDRKKNLGLPQVADVRWQEVNLAVVKEWPERPVLGDEPAARELEKQPLMEYGTVGGPLPKDASREDRRKAEAYRQRQILDAWRGAARAYRQLASVMRDQGMSDEADRFAYRGQVCQRQLYRVQGKRVRRAFSRFLDLLAGYGFKPERSLIAYVLIIAAFAVAYFIIGQTVGPHLSPFGAFVFSMTSFHGRGFFPGGISVDDPLTGTAAFEALAGLIIEISFIATFTQRFFGK